MLPLIVATAGGTKAGGAVANYMGGKAEAKRKQAAIDAYKRESEKRYDNMMRDAWDQGMERQRATGSVIKGLIPTMSAAPTVAPQVADSLPTESGGSDLYRAALARTLAPKTQLAQKEADAVQAGMDRVSVARALDALGHTASLEGTAKAPAHSRYQFDQQRKLARARQELESVMSSTGNKARNLQLLGSLLNTAGDLTMMAGAGAATPGSVNPQAASVGRPMW